MFNLRFRTVLLAFAFVGAAMPARSGSPLRGEVHVWAGASANGGAGLRSVEASAWLDDDWRVWAVYDDSPGIEDPSLRRQGQQTQGYFAGAMHQFHENWQGVLEVGYRHQPGGSHQGIFGAEILHIADDAVTRLGVQVNPHSAGFSDEILIMSHRVRLADGWWVEPTAVYGQLGPFEDDEWRGVLRVEHQGKGWGVHWGIGGGAISSDSGGDSGGIFVADARLTVGVGEDSDVHLSVRHEELPRFETSLLMVGLTLRFSSD